MINNITICGRLTDDLRVFEGKGKTKFAHFSVAVKRSFRKEGEDEFETDFFTVKVFGGLVDYVNNNFSKADKITVNGSIYYDTYKSKQGDNVKAYYIVAREVFG